jgi:hypothetical protein
LLFSPSHDAEEISLSGASDFCDETKVTKNSFRGAAPKDPFLFRDRSVFSSPYAAFRFTRRRALNVGGAMLRTEQVFCRAGAVGKKDAPFLSQM